ncbi:hypothetical protein ACFSTD_14430 [Novosphingobium colocasiae]
MKLNTLLAGVAGLAFFVPGVAFAQDAADDLVRRRRRDRRHRAEALRNR